MDLADFEQKIEVQFNDKQLLRQAFTHRSYLNEHPNENIAHNERLEFLGDAVLELIATEELFERFPEKPEGELTAYRAALVNTVSLADAAAELAVNEYLLLSKGEARDTGKARQYILANTMEAIIGALYLDQGYEVTKKFIAQTLLTRIDEVVQKRLWQDAKSHFQERAQEEVSITPNYHVIKETGPDHAKVFTVGVFLEDEKIAEGEGRSKQDAEQTAAQKALEAKGWS